MNDRIILRTRSVREEVINSVSSKYADMVYVRDRDRDGKLMSMYSSAVIS